MEGESGAMGFDACQRREEAGDREGQTEDGVLTSDTGGIA